MLYDLSPYLPIEAFIGLFILGAAVLGVLTQRNDKEGK